MGQADSRGARPPTRSNRNGRPPAGEGALLSCFEKGLWASGSGFLLNDRFLWDVLSRAGVWDCPGAGLEPGSDAAGDGGLVGPAPASGSSGSGTSTSTSTGGGGGGGASSNSALTAAATPDVSLLGNRLTDLLCTVDMVAQAGQGPAAALARTRLYADFLSAYHAYCRGDDASRNASAVPRFGDSVHETSLAARQALLRALQGALAASRAPAGAKAGRGAAPEAAYPAVAGAGAGAGAVPPAAYSISATQARIVGVGAAGARAGVSPDLRFLVDASVDTLFCEVR
jgi:hypothetical protein